VQRKQQVEEEVRKQKEAAASTAQQADNVSQQQDAASDGDALPSPPLPQAVIAEPAELGDASADADVGAGAGQAYLDAVYNRQLEETAETAAAAAEAKGESAEELARRVAAQWIPGGKDQGARRGGGGVALSGSIPVEIGVRQCNACLAVKLQGQI
jgi:hypothetical protein